MINICHATFLQFLWESKGIHTIPLDSHNILSLEFWCLPRVVDCCPNPPRVRGEPSPSALGFVGLKPGSATAPAKMENVWFCFEAEGNFWRFWFEKKSNKCRTTSICQKHIIRCQYIYIYVSKMYLEMIFYTFISNLQSKKLRRVARFPQPPFVRPAGGLGPVTGDRTASTVGAGGGEASAALPDSCGSVSWRTSMGLGKSLPWKFLFFWGGGVWNGEYGRPCHFS